ncbi:MAG TPA: nucleoside triphosphate pyrophosphatase [Stellaceae bacterium]|nr:nucleoside triphosphate pyrophosphatase [Stellaceae bacterium]
MTILARRAVVLASASVARAKLLEQAGIEVIRDSAGIDEAAVKASFREDGLDAASCATALAETKAARVSARHADALVIGADQILVHDEHWLDKPRDKAEARAQLAGLRGASHELVTAVAVARNGAAIWREVDRAFLHMRAFSDDFLAAYLAAAGDDVLTSVGAYQLEGLGAQLFARIEGDYFSILGLPLLPLLEFLRSHGVVPP